MALQLRRGTAAERIISGVVPAPGELLYTTDDENLYIGDGVTEGGILVTQRLGGYPIEGTFGNLFLINTTQRTGGIATFTTDLEHGLTAGEEIVITNAPDPSYEGTWTVYDVTGVTEFRVNTGGADLPVQNTALYYIDSGGQFPDGASVVWDATLNSFKIRALTKSDVGLDQVDNTADIDKPVSTLQQAAINAQTLDEHSDVIITSPQDGQAVVWSAADEAWINSTVDSGGGGGGTADFPDTYYSYSGIGQMPTGKWLGTNSMFRFNSDTAFKSYKASDTEVIYLENLEWNNHLGIISSNTTWDNLSKNIGDWAFSGDPQFYSISSLRCYIPSSQNNTNLNTWIRNQQQYSNKTFGKYTWEDSVTYYTEEYSLINNGGGTYTPYFPSHTLYNTGRSNPPLESSHTFQEFSFVPGYSETNGKWIGPAYVPDSYTAQSEAEADGWNVVLFNSNSSLRYYPDNGTTKITLPWTWTIAGVDCDEALFSGSGGMLFMPTGTTPFAYPILSYGSAPLYNDPITERWAASVGQYYLAINEVGSPGQCSQAMWKIVNESPRRAMVFRWKMIFSSYFQALFELTIREGDENFQLLMSPVYNFSGLTIAEVLVQYANFMSNIDKLGTGFVGPGGEFITHLGYLCDDFNMNCHPYALTDNVGRIIAQSSENRVWLEPLFSAMSDVKFSTDEGTALVTTPSGFAFKTPGVLSGFLSDAGYEVNATIPYDVTSIYDNGGYSYPSSQPSDNCSSFCRFYINKYDALDVLRTTEISSLSAGTTFGVVIDGTSYFVESYATPYIYSSAYYEITAKQCVGDGPALLAKLRELASNQDTTFAPTLLLIEPVSDGDVLTWNATSERWIPAAPTGGGGLADGDYGDVIVGSSGTTIVIDANVVSNTKLADVATGTIKGRVSSGAGDPEDLSASQVKTLLSLNNVENTALSTWSGSVNLDTVGTITSGTWNGAVIGIQYGGTGQTTASGAINALLPSQTGNSGRSLTTDGVTVSWATIPVGATSLNELTDVTIASAGAGEVLRFNGTSWVDASLDYSDLSGTPALATIATTGSYSDLSGVPVLAAVATSGEYADLLNAPTALSDFSNDVGFISSINLGGVSDVTLTAPTTGDVLSYNGSAWVNTSAPPADISGSSINALNDVDTSTTPPTDGQALVWDSVTSKWEPGSVSAGVVALGDLTDVTISSAATGEVLRFNGTSWVDVQLDYSDLTGAPTLASVATSGDYADLSNTPTIPTSIDDLDDVDTTTIPPTTSQFLGWNGTNWIPKTVNGTGGAVVINDLEDVDTSTVTPAIGQVLKWDGTNWIPATESGGSGGTATLGRGDGGDLDFQSVESAFVFGVYGGGDIDTTAEDKPVELVAYVADGGEIT